MKRITNNLGLPEQMHRAAIKIFGKYDRGDAQISITGLSNPPRKAALETLHEDELEEDLSEVIWALLGSTMHQIFHEGFDETATAADHFAEQRLYATMQGWKVSGALDHYDKGHVMDWKLTSVFSVKNGKPKQDWSEQMNGYAWLLRENGLPADSAEVIVILRDWSKMDALRDSSYPRHQVTRIPVPLWAPEEAEQWVFQRVMAHQAALYELPLCSPEERWERPGKWATMKRGIKRAVRLHDTHAEAAKHVQQLGGDHFVESRPGAAVRCQAYCQARPFCTQASDLG